MPASRLGKFPAAGPGHGPRCSQVSASRRLRASPGALAALLGEARRARRTRLGGTAPGGQGGPGRGARGFQSWGLDTGDARPAPYPPSPRSQTRAVHSPASLLKLRAPISAQPCQCASQLGSRLSAASGRGRLLGPPTGKVSSQPPLLAERRGRDSCRRKGTHRTPWMGGPGRGEGPAMLVETYPASSHSTGGGKATQNHSSHPIPVPFSTETPTWRGPWKLTPGMGGEGERGTQILSTPSSSDAVPSASRCSTRFGFGFGVRGPASPT